MDVHASRCLLRRHSRPLEPLPTGVAPQLRPLKGIRAVLFDVYGTLLVSASGDIGAGADSDRAAAGRAEAAAEALDAAGVKDADGQAVVEHLHETIRADHAAARERGVETPEVDIVDIWRRVLASLGQNALKPLALAVDYESRTNPTWPMPGLVQVLGRLRERDLLLGIISNAQVFTADLFPALLGATLGELGFSHDLVVWSFRHGHAKPGRRLYDLSATALAAREVSPEEVLYVGNDMLKDVWPARQVGFRTALFAGDARSYRPRSDDPRLEGVEPDLVVHRLDELEGCLA